MSVVLSMFHLHFFSFTYKHIYISAPPLVVLTNSVPVDFDHDTIVQLRSTIKKLMLALSQLYHRVEVLSDSPKHTSTAAAACANVEEAGSVSNENLLKLFGKPLSSGSEAPVALQYQLSQESEQQGLSQEIT